MIERQASPVPHITEENDLTCCPQAPTLQRVESYKFILSVWKEVLPETMDKTESARPWDLPSILDQCDILQEMVNMVNQRKWLLFSLKNTRVGLWYI